MTKPSTVVRPVIRSDGAYYRDISDAAFAMARVGALCNYDSAYTNICRVCDGTRRQVTAGGFGWRWANPDDVAEHKAALKARRMEIRRRKVEALKAGEDAPIATDLIGRALKECGLQDNTLGYYELLIQLGQQRTSRLRRIAAHIEPINQDDWMEQ